MSATYALRVDGKYALAQWEQGDMGPVLSWELWPLSIVLIDGQLTRVNKWLKLYRDRELVETWKVPEDAVMLRERILTWQIR